MILNLNLFWTGLCSLFGYSAFVAFLILKNYAPAVLGFISGTTDAVTCFLIFLKGLGTLPFWYDRNALRKFCRLGIVAATIGLLNLGYHVTIQIMHKTPMLPVANSEVVSIVWSFILLRSGIILMYHSIVYQKVEDVRLLPDHNEGCSGEGETKEETNEATCSSVSTSS